MSNEQQPWYRYQYQMIDNGSQESEVKADQSDVDEATKGIRGKSKSTLSQQLELAIAYESELRDRFAMAALTGMLASRDDWDCYPTSAYSFADKMMEARSVK